MARRAGELGGRKEAMEGGGEVPMKRAELYRGGLTHKHEPSSVASGEKASILQVTPSKGCVDIEKTHTLNTGEVRGVPLPTACSF